MVGLAAGGVSVHLWARDPRYREALAHAQQPERSGKVLFTFERTDAS